jgi:hypothetical protein
MDNNQLFTIIFGLFFTIFIMVYFVVCCNKCLNASNHNSRYVILANDVDNNPSNYLNQSNLEIHNQKYKNENAPPEYTTIDTLNSGSSNSLPVNYTYQSFSNLPNQTSNQSNTLNVNTELNNNLNTENYRYQRYNYTENNDSSLSNNTSNQALPFYYQNLTLDERSMLNNPRVTYS